MRSLVAVVGSLVLLAGLGGPAWATATIDLLSVDSGTSPEDGTDTITLGVGPDSSAGMVGLLDDTDGSVEVGFLDPASELTFNAGTLTSVPEPGTASLLALGLGGLYAVGRRQRR